MRQHAATTARRYHSLPGAEFRMGEARERPSVDNGAAPDARSRINRLGESPPRPQTAKASPSTQRCTDEQMTAAQLVQRLEALRFDSRERARVTIDPGVQAFLIRATKAAAADHLDAKVRLTWRLIRPPR